LVSIVPEVCRQFNVYDLVVIYIRTLRNNNHHHHHLSVMELCHLLTRSGLRYPEVSSKVCHDSFSQLWNCVSLPWVIYYEAFYLHVVSSFSCIPVICLPNRHPHLLVVYPPVTNEEITTES